MKEIGFFVGSRQSLHHARALCSSIREIAGWRDGCSLYAVTPAHINLSVDIPSVFHLTANVPHACRSVPFSDKMLAAARFEEVCKGGYLWLDADSFFIEPVEFPLDAKVLVNPVDKRNIGDPVGARSPLWEIVCAYFHLSGTQPYVLTTVTREKIFPYYNAGMVVVRENRKLFQSVGKALLDLLKNAEIRKIIGESAPHRIFFHQVVFSCCLLTLYGGEIQPLPYGVNYPLHLHDENPYPPALQDVRSIRYDTYFDTKDAPALWKHLNIAGTQSAIPTQTAIRSDRLILEGENGTLPL